MCKKLLTNLLGGGQGDMTKRAVSSTVIGSGKDTGAEIKDTNVVNTGREASGRVKLSGGAKGSARVAGLSL